MSEMKTITGWLVVDWRKGSHRTRKSKPKSSELGSNELLAELKVNVEVPEVDVPTLAVDIDVPEPQVYAATLDALDEDELPDWTDAAVEVVEERTEDIHHAAPSGEGSIDTWNDLVSAMTLSAVQNAPGRPSVDRVRRFVDQLAMDLVREGELDPTAVDLAGGADV